MRKTSVKYSALAICLALFMLLSACGGITGSTETPDPDPQSGVVQPAESGTQNGEQAEAGQPGGEQTAPAPVKADALLRASSYEELAQILASLRTTPSGYGGGGSRDENMAGDAAAEEEPAAPSATPTDNESYSGTNVQVAGVDEADIVKTDGRYIYTLSGTDLIIGSANGDGTYTSLSRTQIFETNSDDYSYYSDETGDFEYSYSNENFSGMYVSGTTAALLSSYWSYHEQGGVDEYHSENVSRTFVRFYDVSDPASPTLIGEISQEGSYLDSRLSGGALYIVSSYYDYDYDSGDPAVPSIYENGEFRKIPVDDIAVIPTENPRCCCVVCAYDVSSASTTGTEAVYGSGSYVYMNDDMLCLACCSSELTESEPRTESVYTVVDRTYMSTTHIVGFPVSGGSLGAPVYGNVAGYLESQFSMDMYDGYLRLVTTVSSNSYTVYTDSEYGFENYVWADPVPTTNALWVLDGDMSVCGSIEGLAEEERIYSARFDGEIGYFVTFRSVDPLFAVDLSDPTAPRILSELKIPGFSEYLHKYDDGRLFGLGYAVSDVTNRTTGLKLSMFDVSDPGDVTEKHSLGIDDSYSTALYNHKAILVSAEKNIIAFPTEAGYAIFGYDDETGFWQRAATEQTGDWWGGDMRGLWIGDWFYIVDRYSGTVSVLDLTELTFTGTFEL